MFENYPYIKRVAAYCRVSTDASDQANSLASQKKYFEAYINSNTSWQLAAIYADEGITGTSTKKRKAFNKMIYEAEQGAFDLIITKDLSRFARNTLDSIFYTRKLKELNVGVYFLNDNICTLDADSELRLTIMSSIAQEESRKTSDRVKWGQQRRMEAGSAFGLRALGYDKSGGKLTINEEEAKIVRRIFNDFLLGKGITTIANELEDEGCLTKNGGKKWYPSTIFRILQNEKYCGDLLSKKTVTPNYLEHTSKPNHRQEEKIYISNHHEPIISRDLFEEVQSIIRQRAAKKKSETYRYANRYPFSGKIKCGYCGGSYVRRSVYSRTGELKLSWQCREKTRYGKRKFNAQGILIGCDSTAISEIKLQHLFLSVLKEISFDKYNIKNDLILSIKNILAEDTGQEEEDSPQKISSAISILSEKKKAAIDAYFEGVLTKEDLKEMKEMYTSQIAFLREKLNHVNASASQTDQINLIKQIDERLDNILSCSLFCEEMCFALLDKIMVYNKSKIEIYINTMENSFFRKI